MPTPLPPQLALDLEAVLSPPRFATYIRAAGGDRARAIDLYCWNTEVAAAFYTPIQFAEITVRNAAVEAVENVYGPSWHENKAFQNGLKVKVGRYQMRADLTTLADGTRSSGAVVAELKFVFWQNLYVKTQDGRLWDRHLRTAFPAIPPNLTVDQARDQLYDRIDTVRRLRNRIAHHEPIFSRGLAADLDAATALVEWRRPSVANWIRESEIVSGLLARRP